ncbi:tRNA (guanosine(46)-N7)-methyltransferase TrmB [Virgibacillus sp. NKC19-3]|uniref:tRNA (guanosine(46)-N7)-methyltransferase TrmB n=1 Tax=Virgibacillus saliphilus TaxID=2831674 RepID=UPI001C9A7073|nr:tRNA (guanosine(46)-N7)-methyltransferase TrmB [Virgibacillus sp. NKC19-3]MBY7143909.1 tRNA (guanosine(46)-N7)-methyltransferase TrmB [Virgibacillus sp. NKC19-3]
MRQRHKPWADDFLKSHRHIIIPNPAEHKGDWQSIFGNNNPIYIEIGTGKGQFITGMARQFPNCNFIGIEIEKNIIVTAGQKVADSGLENIVLIKEDAAHLREVFVDKEVSGIYLNFSDPWPKNRHEKRRLTYHTFLDLYRAILEPSGEIVFKTDNKGLFEYSLVSFSKFGMTLLEVNLDLHDLQDPYNVMTEYEEKFSAKGQSIYRCRTEFV